MECRPFCLGMRMDLPINYRGECIFSGIPKLNFYEVATKLLFSRIIQIWLQCESEVALFPVGSVVENLPTHFGCWHFTRLHALLLPPYPCLCQKCKHQLLREFQIFWSGISKLLLVENHLPGTKHSAEKKETSIILRTRALSRACFRVTRKYIFPLLEFDLGAEIPGCGHRTQDTGHDNPLK